MYAHVVVGTDGSETARLAVEHAAHLAKSSGAKLHVVHAVRLPSRAAMVAPEMAAMAASADVDAETWARQLLVDTAAALEADGQRVETHLSARAPADALCEVAEEQMADVIVVGNRGMKGARRILGSVPNDVAHRAGCAVLIVPTC
jgi:nucleotide-binding universal stress UspA family protein